MVIISTEHHGRYMANETRIESLLFTRKPRHAAREKIDTLMIGLIFIGPPGPPHSRRNV